MLVLELRFKPHIGVVHFALVYLKNMPLTEHLGNMVFKYKSMPEQAN